jgi:uncharacterized protein (TIGR03118 family)
MKRPRNGLIVAAGLLIAAATVLLPCGTTNAADENAYVRHNLVSNNTSTIPAEHQDTTLLNPWGAAFFPGGPFWINDNGSGISALYQGDGTGFLGSNPAVAVTIPTPNGTGTSTPTGIVANSSFGFALKANSMPALFIFDTEDGTISAWNLNLGAPGTAELEVDNSTETCANGATGAVYKGLAMGANSAGVFLYAANFRCGTIDVFDSTFKSARLRGSFRDPNIPATFAPFGIANIRGNLAVTYAKQDAEKKDDVAGPGNGFVDIYDTNGNLIKRFASRGPLNSPWGIAQAPFNFGLFSNALLIGNFGDGRINGFNNGGNFLGQLKNPSGRPITIDGLWALIFGGAAGSQPGKLYFTAGPNDEADGVMGTVIPQ